MFFETPAIVLKRTKMQENDLMITLFTRKAGIMNAVAKGGRNPKSAISSGTQQFVFGNFVISVGEHYNYINSADSQFSFYKIREDIYTLGYASYFCELVIKTLKENQINHHLFILLVEILSLMESGEADAPKLKIAFEIKLLSFIGFGIGIDRCTDCGKVLVETDHLYFSPQGGGTICSDCRENHNYAYNLGSVIPKLMVYFTKKDIRIIHKTKINDLYIDKMDKIINEYMSYQLDIGKLKTLEFLKEIKKTGVGL